MLRQHELPAKRRVERAAAGRLRQVKYFCGKQMHWHRICKSKCHATEGVHLLILKNWRAVWTTTQFLHRDTYLISVYLCNEYSTLFLLSCLPVLERSEMIAEWVMLTEDKTAGSTCAGSLPDGRKAGPQHQPRGINAATRELGIDRNIAQRAIGTLVLGREPSPSRTDRA